MAWVTEYNPKDVGITFKIKERLYKKKSAFQKIEIVDTKEFGRMLLLDGCVMLTEKDEYVYHEMLVHIPLFTHPNPEKVLIIGGGDGGSVREVLKHPSVKHIDLVEIDPDVITVSKKFLPFVSSKLTNKRVTIHHEDGAQFVLKCNNAFDVVLVDSTDPVGPAASLVSRQFYEEVHSALREKGVMANQAGSPWFHKDEIQTVLKNSSVFLQHQKYIAHIPSYPSGTWMFILASKKHNQKPRRSKLKLRYYTPEYHKASFILPKNMQKKSKKN